MHEDQVEKELEQFQEAFKKKGRLKVPMKFPATDDSTDKYEGTKMDIPKPVYKKENKERAVEISRKKKRT